MAFLAAAAAIDITPEGGVDTHAGAVAERVASRLDAGLLLLKGEEASVVLLSLNLCYVSPELEAALVAPIAAATGVATADVIIATTRNLSTPVPFPEVARGEYHEMLIRKLARAAGDAASRVQPAQVRFGEGSWPSLQYNRKGVRADGTTFFRREPDRIRQPKPVGLIDPRVPVLRVDALDGAPIALVVQYTGDPCVATNLAEPAISGDIIGHACAAARASLGLPELPILYLQGAKGDVAIKYMFAGEEKARVEGMQLGHRIAEVANAAMPVREDAGPGVRMIRGTARLPLQPLPPVTLLEQQHAEVLRFIAAADAGDGSLDEVLGYNLPAEQPPAARRRYAERIGVWVAWALDAAVRGLPTRRQVDVEIRALAVDGARLLTTWPEPFGSVGHAIHAAKPRRETIFACCCGSSWPDDPGMASWAYVPGSGDLSGNEYMTSFYHFTRFLTQYESPAGDAIATCGLELLHRLE